MKHYEKIKTVLNNVSCYNVWKIHKGDQNGVKRNLETCTYSGSGML